MHPFEKAFDEFRDPETSIIDTPQPPLLTIAKSSRLKGGTGEHITLLQTEDGFTVLGITPPDVDPKSAGAPLICQFFCLRENEPSVNNPSRLARTREQENLVRQISDRLLELCS